MSYVIDLNNSAPAAPSGSVNLSFQKGTSSGIDPSTGLPIYPVSANVEIGTTSVLGVLQADGTSITVSDGVISADLPTSVRDGVLGIVIDGGGSVPSTGVKGLLTVPYGCTISGWTIIADQSGSCSLDVCFLAGSAPPAAPSIPNTSTDKISASAPVALSSAQSAAGGATAISTWTKTLTQWGTLLFNLTSALTCQRITVQIEVQKD